MAFGTRIVTWFDGRWHEGGSGGNPAVMRAADHGTWQGTLVFDGARAWDGVAPDLDRHCARVVRSAEIMGLLPPATAPEIEALVSEGIRRHGSDRPLYLRPMLWSTEATPALIDAVPESTVLAVCIEDLPFRQPGPMTLTVSPFRRPPPDAALCEAKAACHYPNNARVVREARARGFHNALSLDQHGHVAETASTNVFLVREGIVETPAANGTFLNGITRQRVIGLLRDDGRVVRESTLAIADFAAADEIFLTGNANKVVPVTRFEDRALAPGPVTARAWALYQAFAHQRRAAA
jgi:branched-chain amino acid aminotransferase